MSERLCGGANFAEGDGRDDGGSSFSSRCRGEINECGVALDLGEMDGFGEAVSLGVVDGAIEGATEGAIEGFGLGEIDRGVGDVVVVVLFLRFQLKAEVFAKAVSMVTTVMTSPPPNVPRVLFAGNVAVGGWPTGIGS